jgi:hypothetical protein
LGQRKLRRLHQGMSKLQVFLELSTRFIDIENTY